MGNLVKRHASTSALFLLCGWLVFGGAPINSLELSYLECIDEEELGKDDALCLLALSFLTGLAPNSLPPTGTPPVVFETNLGQVDGSYQFVARAREYTVMLNSGAMEFALTDRAGETQGRVRASLKNYSGAAEPSAEEPLPGHVNYFIGNDAARWVTDVPTFSQVRYRSVYPGVDVVYYGKEGRMEFDFVVAPGTDPNVISIALEGATQVTEDGDGNLRLRSGLGEMTWQKPRLYQTKERGRTRVEGRYRLNGKGELGFEVGRYDPSLPLVIDPVIVYSTFLGRTMPDGAGRVVVDANGNSYFTGLTYDDIFPVSAGTFRSPPETANLGNIVVTKLNAAGAPVYTTHLGGAFLDGAVGIAVDSSGSVYLAGSTESHNYPLTPSAIKNNFPSKRAAGSDGMDCVITKLNSAGNALVYSTYFGGAKSDACLDIAVDATGNAYVTGWTTSNPFPVSESAPQRINRGRGDVFVAKLNPAGTGIVWATLLGGTRNDQPTSIAVDAAGNAYVAGHSNSSLGFPVTQGALQTAYAGTSPPSLSRSGDAFVAKINADGAGFGYVTYLGGRGDDVAGDIAVDAQGNVYVAGQTMSENFPTTPGAFRTSFQGRGGNNIFPGGDGFVAKINPAGSSLVWSTYLGGSMDDWATSVALDQAGNVWVGGATLSTNFPISQDATQRTYRGSDPESNFPTGDAFLVQLSSAGSALMFGTYLGGIHDDFVMGVALDRSNNVWVTGSTRSRDFITTAGAIQRNFGGTTTTAVPLGDALITKFGDAPPPAGGNVSLGGIVSNASFIGGAVAPGEIVFLGGSNIGPGNLLTAGVTAAGTLSTVLGETRVLFDGQASPLIYVSGTQTSAIVPYRVAGQASTQVVVEYRGERSAPLVVPVVASRPGLFSANSSGRGQGAILNENNSFNSAANPARKGSIVQLFGTGEGQTNPPGVDGQLATQVFPRPVLPVSVTIGGRTADLLYAGAAPSLVAGLLQVNAKIPEDSPSGDLEVIVTAGNARSQTGLTVAVQ
ncbi:MAG: hypothetical protein FJW20_01115 [Acidimicrobiia bacterium]|nr:hypothetical protein [Acidimicrobiia bacterium]